MTAQEFKLARQERRWTQVETAERLGVSQTYVALLEQGKRKFPAKLARKVVTVLHMNPGSLPVETGRLQADAETLARQFSALGYPGFAYMRPARKRNPVELLLAALAQDNLEPRLTEALPWLLLHYSGMTDVCKDWLLEQVRLRNLTNRLGFVVTTAKQVLENRGETTSQRYRDLEQLEKALYPSRLVEEDTLCQSSLSQHERAWLKENRPDAARTWNLLTDWQPQHLQYV